MLILANFLKLHFQLRRIAKLKFVSSAQRMLNHLASIIVIPFFYWCILSQILSISSNKVEYTNSIYYNVWRINDNNIYKAGTY